jgi:DNA-directed RNA polymerase sigma subunit (sigma70/sigma32)
LKKLADDASQEDASKMMNLSSEKLISIFERADRIERAILKSQLKLVQSIALQHKDMGWTLGDLVEEGLRGVQNAILQFDPEKGTSFSAFANSMIKTQIRNAVSSASLISTSKKVKNLVHKVRTVQTAMKSRLGRSATDEEVAAEMGKSDWLKLNLINVSRHIS